MFTKVKHEEERRRGKQLNMISNWMMVMMQCNAGVREDKVWAKVVMDIKMTKSKVESAFLVLEL